MKSGELFAGVGGLGMAVDDVFGTTPAWFCEFDEAPSKVLAHRLPGVPNYGDVRAVDFTAVPHTHVRSGGFPCQDVSLAGRRLGLSAGKRSGLWSEFARSIEEDRPDWVVIENVRGLLSAEGEPWHDELIDAHDDMKRLAHLVATAEGFASGNPARRKEGRSAHARRWKHAAVRIARHHKRAVARFNAERRLVQRAIAIVLRDLADLGFDAEWTGLRASDVGAPHGRFRVFILAWPSERTPQDAGHGQRRSPRPEPAGSDDASRGSDRGGSRGGDNHELTRAQVFAGDWGDWDLLPTPVTEPDTGNGHARNLGKEMQLLPTPVAQPSGNTPTDHLRKKPGREIVTDLAIIAENGLLESGGKLLPTPDAYSGSRGGSQHPDKRRDGGHTVSLADVTEHQSATDWGPYAPAIARWESVIGRPAPAPVRHDGKGGKPRLNPELTEWMMGWPAGWVTDPEIGLTRAEQLKACGNGVVPQQAAAALREMLARPGVPAIREEVAA